MYLPNSLFYKTEVDADSVVVLEPLTVALHALDKAAITPGEVVVIQGSGAIGLLTLVGAINAGATKTIVIGAPKGRLELARELGADITVDISEVSDMQDRIAFVKENTPNGFGGDVVLECAGVPIAVREGLEMLREGGRFVEVGNFTDNGEVEINPFKHMIAKNCIIYGVWGAYPKHFVKGLRLIEKNPDIFKKLVTHKVPLEKVQEMMEALSGKYNYDGKDIIKAVVKP